MQDSTFISNSIPGLSGGKPQSAEPSFEFTDRSNQPMLADIYVPPESSKRLSTH